MKPELPEALSEDQINALTEKIIGCVYRVANALGCGFLEKVYENALAYELKKKWAQSRTTMLDSRVLRWHLSG